MIRTLGPAQGGSPQKEPAAGPSLSSLPSVQIPSPQAPGPSPSPDPAKQVAEEIPLLSREEKRRILAQIVRLNPLDCFDDSGAFDVARAKKVLPPGAVRHIVVHETTRTDPEGNPVTQRKIHLRLVDPLSAMRLDDQLERRRESPPAPAVSDDLSADSAEKEAEREAGAARARIALHEMVQDAFEEGRRSALSPTTTAKDEPSQTETSALRPSNKKERGCGEGPLAKHSCDVAHPTGAFPVTGEVPASLKPVERVQKSAATPKLTSPSLPLPSIPPVQITPPKKIHTPPSAEARPPPLHPMSFAAQGRPRIIE